MCAAPLITHFHALRKISHHCAHSDCFSQHQNHIHPKNKGKHGPHLSLTPVGLQKAAQDRSAAHRPTYRAPNTNVPEALQGTAANKRVSRSHHRLQSQSFLSTDLQQCALRTAVQLQFSLLKDRRAPAVSEGFQCGPSTQ